MQIENFSTLLEAVAINYHGIVGELDFEAILSVSAYLRACLLRGLKFALKTHVQVNHIKYLAFIWWVLYIFFVVIAAFNMILAIVLRTWVSWGGSLAAFLR